LNKDYKTASETYSNEQEENVIRDKELISGTNYNFTPVHSRQCSFKAIVDYGIPLFNSLYERKIANVKCRLQPGFEIIRSIRLESNDYVDLHLKIERSDDGPIFKGFTKTNPVISDSGSKITLVMNSLFKKLKVETNKKWSRYEFFGLTRSDVIGVISKPPKVADEVHNENMFHEDVRSSKSAKNDNSLLQDIANIRRRNAGATGDLCPKAVKARNATIHKLVEYASFGDVSSKFKKI